MHISRQHSCLDYIYNVLMHASMLLSYSNDNILVCRKIPRRKTASLMQHQILLGIDSTKYTFVGLTMGYHIIVYASLYGSRGWVYSHTKALRILISLYTWANIYPGHESVGPGFKLRMGWIKVFKKFAVLWLTLWQFTFIFIMTH